MIISYMQYLYIFVPFLLSFIVSIFCIPRIVVIAYKKRLFDNLEFRKVHSTITPRLGGVSFLISIILATTGSILMSSRLDHSIQIDPPFLVALCSLTILCFVGAADDLVGVKYKVKFAAQFIAAALTIESGLYLTDLYGILEIHSIPSWIGIIFCILFIVFVINSINLIDGIDGLAAGICGVSFAVVGTILWFQSQFMYAIISFASLGMLLPFLYFNVFVKKCKIFMGDSGSLVLGYLVVFLIIRLGISIDPLSDTGKSGQYLFIGVSTILVPILDTLRVMLYRQMHGYHIFKPDRNHIHHKFLAAGFTSRECLVLILFMAFVIVVLNVALIIQDININIILFIDILFYTAINKILSKKIVTTDMIHVKSKRKWLLAVTLTLALTSCATRSKVVYMQNQQVGQQQALISSTPIVLQPQDQISIIVSCREPQLTALFNLTYVSQVAGSLQDNTSAGYGKVAGYTVDSEGNINFPILGRIQVAGLSREEIARRITDELEKRNLVKEPIVTVEFLSLYFSVLGEVNKPGRYTITKDKVTFLEALSMAGDLTIFGKREHIFLSRQEKDSMITYQLDLRSTDIYQSPVFYLKQGDIIYVEPNRVRANQSTVNGNSVMSVSLWMSVASFLTTIGVLIFK